MALSKQTTFIHGGQGICKNTNLPDINKIERLEELSLILKQCALNDRAAQQQLYMHFYDDMYRLCYRYVTEPQATVSVVNDGFLKVFKNIHQYDEKAGAFKPWLKRVMVNTAIDYLRKKKTDVKVVEMNAVYEPSQEDTGLNFKWSQQELLRCLNQLPAMTRMVVNLVAFEGYSHREIAQQLDISEGASRWHLSEARKRLKQVLAVQR